VFRWELEDLAVGQLAGLPPQVQLALADFMDAVVIVDPAEYQRRPGEPERPLRTPRRVLGAGSSRRPPVRMFGEAHNLLEHKIDWLARPAGPVGRELGVVGAAGLLGQGVGAW
jgi:hypothetical protein